MEQTCVRCERPIEGAFRFCPWCAAPQRRKLVEFFAADPRFPDPAGRMLRVSRYLRTPDQDPHVRFSVWNDDGVAQAALSLDEAEAQRLASFLRPPATRPRRLRELIEHIRL